MSADSTFVPDPEWPTIVELATERWGQPNGKLSKRDDIRFGSNGSKSVKPSNNTWHDHEAGEGGGYIEMHRATRGSLPKREQKSKPKHTKGNGQLPPWEDVATTYPYHDGAGDLILEVVRTHSGAPRFRQRRPNGKGCWTWSVKDLPAHDRLLYRLPGLRASGDTTVTVWVTEGEKDADRLHDEGLIATTNIGGAGKWRDEYAEEFRGKHCVVLQDNDQAGRDHTAAVAFSLIRTAASVKVLLLPGLPEKGDVSDWLDAGGTVDDLERLGREAPEATSADADGPDAEEPDGDVQIVQGILRPITTIPPRRWAYGKFLLFGSAACIGAKDGAGKGLVTTAMAIAMITGLPLLGEKVWRTGPVAIITYEDDQDEWERRIAAVCLHYSENGHPLDYEIVIKSFYFLHKPGGRVTLAERTKDSGLIFPDTARIVHFLKKIDAVMLIIDPFNSAHGMEDGNNNVAIAAVAQEITSIAQQAHVAALLLHHLRKGANGSIDDLMGAVALRANFRSVRILQVADEATATGLGIPPTDAWRYLWVAGTKENYAPPPLDRIWFHKASVRLGNPAGIYPEGDEVGVIKRWTPPAAFEGMDYGRLRDVFAAIAAKPHSPDKRAKAIDWIGKPLEEIGGRNPTQATKIINLWLESKTLIEGLPFKTDQRRNIKTLTVDPAKVAAILAQHAAPSRPQETAND